MIEWQNCRKWHIEKEAERSGRRLSYATPQFAWR
jgi:hypothetical protein